MTCKNCKYCRPVDACGCDCECTAKSDREILFEVSKDDDITFYGEHDNEPCKDFKKS